MDNMTTSTGAAGFAPAQARFALGAPRPGADPDVGSEQGRSVQAGVFGQRFFRTVGALSELEFPPYRYCHERQLAVVDDGSDEPLIHRLVGWDKTTTGSSDSKDKLQEEWTMDFLR
jgi:hypothetical protein